MEKGLRKAAGKAKDEREDKRDDDSESEGSDGDDPLIAEVTVATPEVEKRCRSCGRRSVRWRIGPDWKGTLCNMCGLQLHYAKLTKRMKPGARTPDPLDIQKSSPVRQEEQESGYMADDESLV